MSDSPAALIRRALDALPELEAQIAGGDPSPEALRAWARAHFQTLLGLERTLRQSPAEATPSEPAAPDLLDPLKAVTRSRGEGALATSLAQLLRLTQAQRGFIALRNSDGTLSFPVAQAFETLPLDAPEVLLSRSILDAALSGETTVVEDASQDARFRDKQSVQALNLKAVLATPLLGRDGPFGVVYLDSPKVRGAFAPEARELAVEFAQIVAPLLERELLLSGHERRVEQRLSALRERFDFETLVGRSPAWLAALETAAKVARTDASVFLSGETGTGKELMARAIHANSGRADAPFIVVNCAALPGELVESELFGHEKGSFTGAEGLRIGRFEAADGGTIMLDEVGELPLSTQVKLLRVLEDHSFERLGSTQTRRSNIRLITATNRDLEAEVSAGRFRADMLYRLKVVEITLPPLRLRDGDLPSLVAHFVAQLSRRHRGEVMRVSSELMAALEAYRWPGNVRELRNVIERAVVLSEGAELEADTLPAEIGGPSPREGGEGLKAAVWAFKRRYVASVLEENDGAHADAAAQLGVNAKYLYKLLKDLELA